MYERAYLQCICCKVKPQIQRELSHTIKSRCACVWIYGGYPNSTLLLQNLSETWKYFYERTWTILFISLFFSGGHLSTHCFKYLRHLFIFFLNSFFYFLSFFMNNFCIALCLFSITKLLRDSNKNLEHLFGGWKT